MDDHARAEAVIAEWVDAREICSIRPFLTTDLARRIAALLAETRAEYAPLVDCIRAWRQVRDDHEARRQNPDLSAWDQSSRLIDLVAMEDAAINALDAAEGNQR